MSQKRLLLVAWSAVLKSYCDAPTHACKNTPCRLCVGNGDRGTAAALARPALADDDDRLVFRLGDEGAQLLGVLLFSLCRVVRCEQLHVCSLHCLQLGSWCSFVIPRTL